MLNNFVTLLPVNYIDINVPDELINNIKRGGLRGGMYEYRYHLVKHTKPNP